ncbi:hypothetical protein Tco_0990931 [Tanacetum coccineum]|uniref:Uncharacterized protein n=1 Tax=Tanacetum coccineum TaxID=301880 RepID=A0ABQ5EY81_9ASTR
MHIRNDPTSLTNKTGAPQVRTGHIKPCRDSSSDLLTITLSFRRHQSKRVARATGAAPVPNQFETPLVESEEGPYNPQEILRNQYHIVQATDIFFNLVYLLQGEPSGTTSKLVAEIIDYRPPHRCPLDLRFHI